MATTVCGSSVEYNDYQTHPSLINIFLIIRNTHFGKIDPMLFMGLKIMPLRRRQYEHFEFNGPGCVCVCVCVCLCACVVCVCMCVREREREREREGETERERAREREMFWGAV